LEHLELHESLFVVYAESSLVGGGVAVVVAEIEAVGVRPDVEQLLLLLLLGYSWMMPQTCVYYLGILVSAALVVCSDCWLLVGDADCPFHDEMRSRPESFGITNIYQMLLLGYQMFNTLPIK
jgi:hypothetical protein